VLRTVLINFLVWAAYAYDIFTLAMACVQFIIERYHDATSRFANRSRNVVPTV